MTQRLSALSDTGFSLALRRVHRCLFRAALVGVLLTLIGLGARVSAATMTGDIRIDIIAQPDGRTSNGYREHRIQLRNSGLDARQVCLRLVGDGHGRTHLSEIKRTVDVGPGSSVIVALSQPPVPMANSMLIVEPDRGKRVKRPFLNVFSHRPGQMNYSDGHKVHLLLSRRIDKQVFEQHLERYADNQPGGLDHNDQPFELLRAESDTVGWSHSWLAYSCYEGVVLTGDELQAMPAEVRAALWRFVECGGVLTVLGGDAPTERRIDTTELPLKQLRVHYAGFGVCIHCRGATAKALTHAQIATFVRHWLNSAKPWQDKPGLAGAHHTFPVIEKINVPTRGFFLIMILFALISGPVNIFLLSRINRRIWLLVTTPLLSLATCLIVIVYALASEGWLPEVRVTGVTILDQRTHHAISIGIQGYYTPLPLSDGLHFSAATELTPLLAQDDYGGAGRTVDWTHDQHLRRGWIQPRVPAYFMVRQHALRRERLKIRAAKDNTVTVVNGLGVALLSVTYMDATGRLYEHNGYVAAGAEATLAFKDLPRTMTKRHLRDYYRDIAWVEWVDLLAHDPGTVLRPGTYLALTHESPFLDPGLDAKARLHACTVVFGLMHEEDAAP